MLPKIGEKPPKWMVKIMGTPYCLMDDLGGKPPIFGSTQVYVNAGNCRFASENGGISPSMNLSYEGSAFFLSRLRAFSLDFLGVSGVT